MLVRVDNGAIFLGERGKLYTCPVALAIGHAFHITPISVRIIDDDRVNVGLGPTNHIIDNKSLVDWIKSFDAGKSVSPFSFYMEI